MRNHHLRERRMKLGATQELIGCLAGWRPSGAQPSVSAVERGVTTDPQTIRRVRDAIVYLELEPRRRREWARADAKKVEVVEAAILLKRNHVVIERLVDLLFEGRCEDFDELALRVDAEIVSTAGELYLEGVQPDAAAT